ncbi:membrane protein PM19L isoform X1 [Elaeis guineensis]|uniref:membrane protein PM19L isoform X1 n=1 Tax=Elaeis guineensis var. tenera TaxID=51953 RepID=UPI003C6CC5C4
MASEGPAALASILLFLNLIMYIIVAAIAGWALNYSIDETPYAGPDENRRDVSFGQLSRHATDSVQHSYALAVLNLPVPIRLFPIYDPIGNLATGFFVIFALIAGVVGIATSLSGLRDVLEGSPASLLSAAASSIITWALTLLAMGLACKEISISLRPPNLRTLEALTIILSGTQLLCAGALNAGATATTAQERFTGRR